MSETRLLTVEEVNAAAARYNRHGVILATGTFAAMLIGFGIAFAFIGAFRALVEQLGAVAGILPLLPAVAFCFAGIWWSQQAANADASAKCPHCGKLLVRYRSIVIATRNCPDCGRRAIAEPT